MYLRTILEELGIDQSNATILYEGNQGVLLMTRAKQPTRRTRHVDTSQFAILDWIEHDLLALKFVSNTDNASDVMTKALPRILHYKHFDRLMGRIVPKVFRNNEKLEIIKEIKKGKDDTEEEKQQLQRKQVNDHRTLSILENV